MIKFLRKITFYKLIPVAWTLVTIILLCLPGSMLPNEQTFALPNFDKVVHVGLFGGIALFWSFHYLQKETNRFSSIRIILFFTAISILLGTALEFVQLKFIPNRDFDVYDIAADTVGALLAMAYILLATRMKERAK